MVRYMMIKMDRYQLIGKSALALLVSFTLIGCEVPDKSEVPMPEKPYELQHDSKTLTLHFHKQQNKLSKDEQARLLAALKPYGPGKMSIHITISSKDSGLNKQRLKDIIRTALQAGVKAKQIHRSDKLSAATGSSVEILLDTYRAIPPRCPNWSTTYGTGYNRGTTSNFGCSTASNFLLMIDDPVILFKGEQALSRDGSRDSLAIADHRAGKDKGKWLKVDKSDTSSGSSGGSSGSSSAGSS
jgi:pilus assembly protein CpaD